MKSDKQTENNAQIFFRNVIEETGFIDKLRTVTQVIKGRLSQHDTRNAEKIVYPYEYLFTVILLAGMAGYKTKDEVRVFWRANSDFFSKVFPDLFGDIPSTSTITRAQRIIENSVMGDVIKDIMSRHYNLVRVCRKIYATEVLSMRDVLACDGQAMRATDRLQPDGPIRSWLSSSSQSTLMYLPASRATRDSHLRTSKLHTQPTKTAHAFTRRMAITPQRPAQYCQEAISITGE